LKFNKGSPTQKTLKQIGQTFEYAGIEFLKNDGVAKRTGGVQTLEGRSGFLSFILDVYETIKHGGDVYVSDVHEDDFLKWEGDQASAHMARMASVKNLHCKFLIEEGDTNLVASHYASYRQIPKTMFGNIPFYIYGEKTALIVFDKDNVEIFVIKHEAVTKHFRKKFLEVWAKAKPINLPKT
jgi:hypothetical protein